MSFWGKEFLEEKLPVWLPEMEFFCCLKISLIFEPASFRSLNEVKMHVYNKTNHSFSSNVLFYLIVGQAQEDTVISIH